MPLILICLHCRGVLIPHHERRYGALQNPLQSGQLFGEIVEILLSGLGLGFSDDKDILPGAGTFAIQTDFVIFPSGIDDIPTVHLCEIYPGRFLFNDLTFHIYCQMFF